MSVQEIEAELDKLSLDELRRLTLKSWSAFIGKENSGAVHECDEDNPALLSALDQSISEAEQNAGGGLSVQEARQRLDRWISK